jgi:hypothetical protein
MSAKNEVPARLLPHAKHGRNRLGHESGVGQGGELDQRDSILEPLSEGPRHFEGQPRLADAAWAGHGQQAGGTQEFAQLSNFLLPSDEAGERQGQCPGRAVRTRWQRARGHRLVLARAAPGGSQQRRGLLGVRLERGTQPAQGAEPRRLLEAPLEVADSASTQPGAISELRLRQAMREAMPTEDLRKGRRGHRRADGSNPGSDRPHAGVDAVWVRCGRRTSWWPEARSSTRGAARAETAHTRSVRRRARVPQAISEPFQVNAIGTVRGVPSVTT